MFGIEMVMAAREYCSALLIKRPSKLSKSCLKITRENKINFSVSALRQELDFDVLSSKGRETSNAVTDRLLKASRNEIGEWHLEMVGWRRKIHSHPELAFQELVTSEYVAKLLIEWGYNVEKQIGGTGVVATLTRGDPSQKLPAIMLRADMDALPMSEHNEFDHRSQRHGAMHACGHDGHTAMLLGAARHLSLNDCFRGTVHLAFQPAEEGTPTENNFGLKGSGAVAMVEDGLLQKYPVQAVYGLHNWPGLDVGRIAIHSTAVMAGVENFTITVNGIGCHAAMPHLGRGRDSIVCAAQIVTALQSLVSRQLDPQDCAVVSVTQFHAGDAFNVIPTNSVLKGTIRTFQEATHLQTKEGMQRMASQIASAYGCQAQVDFKDYYPPTINTPAHALLCARAAAATVGETNVDFNTLPPSMGGEDFGYLLQRVPGCYVWLGNGPTEGGCMLHNPKYDFNDDILALGARYWVEVVKECLPVDLAST